MEPVIVVSCLFPPPQSPSSAERQPRPYCAAPVNTGMTSPGPPKMGPRKGEGGGNRGGGGQAQVGKSLEAVARDKGPKGSEALGEGEGKRGRERESFQEKDKGSFHKGNNWGVGWINP